MARRGPRFILGVAASAGLNALAHLASTKALKHADASLVAPMLVFSPVFTVRISAVVLGETPSVRGVIGVGLVLIGAYWLNRGPGAGRPWPVRSPLRDLRLALKPGVALMPLAGLLLAVTPLLEKLAILHTQPENPRVVALAVNVLLGLLLVPTVLARGRTAMAGLGRHRREWLIAGLIAGTTPVLGFAAIGLGPVGYVTTLFKMSTALTVLWSHLILGEAGLAQRVPASLVMVAGAVVIVA